MENTNIDNTDPDRVGDQHHSSELSRATPSQRLAVGEFIESQSQEKWNELVQTIRRGKRGRQPGPIMDGASAAEQISFQSTDERDYGSKSDGEKTAVPHSSWKPATIATDADAAYQNRALMGVENTSFDDDDAPLSAGQIAASYKEMENAIKSIENAEALTPPPFQNGAFFENIVDRKNNTAMGLKLMQEKKRPVDPEPGLGSTSSEEVQQPPFIDTTVLPAGHASATDDQEDHPGSSLEDPTTVPSADHASAAVNQGAHPLSELQQPSTVVAPVASSVPSRLSDDTQVGHGRISQITAVPWPPRPSTLVATPSDQFTTADPWPEVEATLVDAEVYHATRLSDRLSSSRWRPRLSDSPRRRLKHMIIVLVLIIGVMAGIVGTLLAYFAYWSKPNVNASYLGVRGEATSSSPSSSFAPSSVPTQRGTICVAQTGQCGSDTDCASIGYPGMCCSQWGYCGTPDENCGACCQNGPCLNLSSGSPPMTTTEAPPATTTKAPNCPAHTDQCGSNTDCASIGYPDLCCSQWGICGGTDEHCGACCQNGPCINLPSTGNPPTGSPPTGSSLVTNTEAPPATAEANTTAATTEAPPATTDDDDGDGYCNWANCNGQVEGGDWCNRGQDNCEAGCDGQWCTDTPGPLTDPEQQCGPNTSCASIGQPGMCCSQWGYCGASTDHCGVGCQNEPCLNPPTGGTTENTAEATTALTNTTATVAVADILDTLPPAE